MKIVANLLGLLLGLAFVAFSLMYYFTKGDQPQPPEGTPAAHFAAAFGPTGYMDFVKAMELLGGLLTAIPFTRNFGLIILGAITVNILAFHYFVMDGVGLLNPILIAIVVVELCLLVLGGKRFGGLATSK